MKNPLTMGFLHSLVIPVFNEREGLKALATRISTLRDQIKSRGDRLEVLLVNDGSRDGSEAALDEIVKQDIDFKVIHFSRNFGHQVAITAGIEWSKGDTVSVLDADLQDPPEVILDFIKKWKEGFQVVYGVRNHRKGETVFKLMTAKIFYRLIRKMTQVEIPVDTGDFRLMDRKAVDAFMALKERHRFVRGMVSWVGFKQTGVTYNRAERAHGSTHYPFKKMLKFALDGITSFSSVPLQISIYLGLTSAFLAFCVSIWALLVHFLWNQTIQGWTSLILVVLFLGGCQLVSLGVIGEYLGRIYDEVKGRPLYFIARKEGF